MFKIGDKVESIRYGNGIITKVWGFKILRPIEVTFENGRIENYTSSGKEIESELTETTDITLRN